MYSTRVCSLVNLRGGWVGRGGNPPAYPPTPPAYPPTPPTPHPPTLPPPTHLPPPHPPTHNLHHHQLTHLNKEKTKTKRNWQKLPPMNSRSVSLCRGTSWGYQASCFRNNLNASGRLGYCYVFNLGFSSQYGIDYISINLSPKVLNLLVELYVHLLILTRQHLYSYQ